MRELKSRGCVTVRETESTVVHGKLLDGRFTILQGENGNQIISHIPRGTIFPYTSLQLTRDGGLTFDS